MTEIKTISQSYFVGLSGVSTLLIALIFLPYYHDLSVFLFIIGASVQLLYGIYFIAKLWQQELPFHHITPALYLPTVAGNFVTSLVAGFLEYTHLGYFFMGIGFFSWLSLESIISDRIKKSIFPNELSPSIGIMMAPPAIACAAYLSNIKKDPDTIGLILFGYAIFQLLIFIKLFCNWIIKQPFSYAFWSFSFGITTITSVAMQLSSKKDILEFKYLAFFLFIMANTTITYLLINTLKLAIVNKKTFSSKKQLL